MKVTGWSNGLEVTADGEGIVSHARAGAVAAAGRCHRADRWLVAGAGHRPLLVHDRGRVTADLACAIADGRR